jgi:flagellar assembly protein FliH
MKMNSSTKNDGEMKKFLFDTNDFDKPARVEKPAISYSEEQLMLAKTQAHAQGKQEAATEARAAQELQTQKLLDTLIALVERLVAAEDRREVENMMAATKLALRVTHKLLPQMAERFSLAEIEGVILSSLDVRKDEQRIAVMIPPQHMDALKDRIDRLALDRGFAGKMILIADDNLGPSDCRVEWADGGAERMYERLSAQIEMEFAQAIAVMQKTIETDTE